MSAAGQSERRRAGYNRSCGGCGGTIARNDTYLRSRVLGSGRPAASARCAHCAGFSPDAITTKQAMLLKRWEVDVAGLTRRSAELLISKGRRQ